MYAMVRVLAGVKGIGVRTSSCTRYFSVLCGIAGLWRATPALPVRFTADAQGCIMIWILRRSAAYKVAAR
jgi:hypothetical protein